jgi:hypothetical protein
MGSCRDGLSGRPEAWSAPIRARRDKFGEFFSQIQVWFLDSFVRTSNQKVTLMTIG